MNKADKVAVVNFTVDFIAKSIINEASNDSFVFNQYGKPDEQSVAQILLKPDCGEFVFCGLKIKDWPHDMPQRVKNCALSLLESRLEVDPAKAGSMTALFDEAFTRFLEREGKPEVVSLCGARKTKNDELSGDVVLHWNKNGVDKSITVDALLEKIDKVLDAIG